MPSSTVSTSSAADPAGRSPRWYAHAYNRPELYALAARLGWVPRRARLSIARAIGRLAPRRMPAECAAVRRSLERMTGATAARLDALVLRTFGDFAMCFSDLVSTNREPARSLRAHLARVEGTDQLTDRPEGFISLTAHVGNWELAGRLLAGRAARTTHVVVAPDEAAALTRWLRRDGEGLRFVPRSRPAMSVELVAALRRREVVAVQGDRALGDRGDVLVPFFGSPAPFPLGPFVLARAVGVPMIPAFCLLDHDYRYTVKVLPPLTVVRGAEEDAVRAWVAGLESVVRERPTQWFNFFDVWGPRG